jgi:hypothetical protein
MAEMMMMTTKNGTPKIGVTIATVDVAKHHLEMDPQVGPLVDSQVDLQAGPQEDPGTMGTTMNAWNSPSAETTGPVTPLRHAQIVAAVRWKWQWFCQHCQGHRQNLALSSLES